MRRYPHTAVIQIETIDESSGFPTATTQEIEVVGRYEPNPGNKSLDYSAKFFPQEKLAILDENPHALDGQKMAFGGRQIGIVQAWNFQTHTEIWLD